MAILTETVLGLALTQVTGGIQTALTVFVVSFAPAVAGAFFFVLWHRPHHFYPPSEFGDQDPEKYMRAIRESSIPQGILDQLPPPGSVKDIDDVLFPVLDGTVDAPYKQIMILMHDKGGGIEVDDVGPHFRPFGGYETGDDRTYSRGGFSPGEMCRKLKNTELVEMSRDGSRIQLTDRGVRFAMWLVQNGKRAKFLKTPFGGWGEATKPEGMPDEMFHGFQRRVDSAPAGAIFKPPDTDGNPTASASSDSSHQGPPPPAASSPPEPPSSDPEPPSGSGS